MFLLFLLAQAGATGDELIALDRRIQAAMVANDIEVLRRSLADDLRFTHSDGAVESKADIMRAAALRPRYYLRRNVVHAAAELHGSFALVFGSLDVASGLMPGDPPTSKPVCYALNYVHVFEKRDGRWQLLSHRTTELTKPERACPTGT